jgi:hypothetical protein
MKTRLAIGLCTILSGIFVLAVGQSAAQQPKGAPPSAGANPNATSTSSQSTPSGTGAPTGGSALQGLSYARESWDEQLVLQNPKILGLKRPEDMIVVCYKLVPGNSATQPFILEPETLPAWEPAHIYKSGDAVVPTKANGHYYVYTYTIKSRSMAPNFATNGAPTSDREGLAWIDEGTSPPNGLAVWTADHPYAQGDLVVPPPDQPAKGHYYEAQVTIKPTGDTEPLFPMNGSSVADPKDSPTFSWKDSGIGTGGINPRVGTKCNNISPDQPLLMDQILVVAIDIAEIKPETLERFKILNFNITNQQGTSLNPTPIRPSIASGTATGSALSGAAGFSAAVGAEGLKTTRTAYFLTWPNQLPGDTIPTVSVNLVYTPVAPALTWTSGTFYPAGSIVMFSDTKVKETNGHYYLALRSGISEKTPDPSKAQESVQTFPDSPGVGWKDIGTTAPATGPAPHQWLANQKTQRGDHLGPIAPGGHYYEAQYSGTTGSTAPVFPVDRTSVADGTTDGLTWTNRGRTALNSPQQPWKSGTEYSDSEQVVPPGAGNGHYYQAVGHGKSGAHVPDFKIDGTNAPDVPGLQWRDMGLITYSSWQQGIAYAVGTRVLPSPPNGFYYEATNPGVSGMNAPAFSTTVGDPTTEAPYLVWLDAGTTQPATVKNLRAWAASTPFFSGDAILYAQSGHYYTVIQPGISGFLEPSFSIPAPPIIDPSDPNEWQDLGTSLPASVTLGIPPTDQTVNLLTYTYAQAHALSRFNLTSGVVVDFIKPPNVVNTGTASAPVYTKSAGTALVDPILAVTVYIKPIDAERQFRTKDLIPGATIGFSLTSPSSNFYFGGSSELFIRNLQVVYGVAALKITELGPLTSGMSTSTSTVQNFKIRPFVGVSFNITGFLQSIF